MSEGRTTNQQRAAIVQAFYDLDPTIEYKSTEIVEMVRKKCSLSVKKVRDVLMSAQLIERQRMTHNKQKWTSEELDILHKFCSDGKKDFKSVVKVLPERSYDSVYAKWREITKCTK